MSLITRCPTCQTLFKVVPDQLRISEGWARCGSCHEIFDATLGLIPETTHVDETPLCDPTPESRIEKRDEFDAGEPVATLASIDSEQTSDGPPPEPATAAEINAPSFLAHKRETRFWSNRVQRVVLPALILGLSLGLVGQIVFHERDQIAALQPELKPWLTAFCSPFKCKVSGVRQKESIAIDHAAFSKAAGNSYRLSFTLRNTSNLALSMPAVELTLTDSGDQAVLRRVIFPFEMDPRADTLAANAEWSTSLDLAVNLSDTAQQTVGYRLYAFYP